MKFSNKLIPFIILAFLFISSAIPFPGEHLHTDDRNAAYKDSIIIPPVPYDSLSYFYGSRIMRSLSLLSTGNEYTRNKIKILFYGQSIVQGLDTKSMIGYLRELYPFTEIEYENLAIGGFQAPNLVRTAVHDLYPYYPDLLIFHVYGGEESGDLERIIYNTRKYTTADILLFNHHYGWESNPEKLAENIKSDDESSQYWLYLAQKYGCELVDVRKQWKTYLDTYSHININSLMGDTIHSNVHPNKKGNKLLELLILEHLKPNPNLLYLPFEGYSGNVKEYEIKRFAVEKGDEINYKGKYEVKDGEYILNEGELDLIFTGNRIILNTFPQKNSSEIKVLIDGRPPSENPDLYYATRPSKAYSHWRPALKRVSLGSKPVLESWTLTITDIDRKSELIKYEVNGSKTGFDGKGNNKQNFISESGNIEIEASDFFIFESEVYTKKPTPSGFTIDWEVKPLFNDTIHVIPDQNSYLIAQGMTNTSHNLKLIIEGESSLKSITVFSPSIK